MQDDLLEPDEAAQCLRISVKNVHRLVRDGKLSCVQYSRKKRFFKKSHLDEFIDTPYSDLYQSLLTRGIWGTYPRLRKGVRNRLRVSGTDLAKKIRSLWQ